MPNMNEPGRTCECGMSREYIYICIYVMNIYVCIHVYIYICVHIYIYI